GKRRALLSAGSGRAIRLSPALRQRMFRKPANDVSRRSGYRFFMPQKVRIALDAMGGDDGVSVVVAGAAISLKRHPDTAFLLFGDSARIEAELARHPALKAASRVIHTDVAVSMSEKPSQALRRGRKVSSMWRAIDAVKTGDADAAVSAGNTGAL